METQRILKEYMRQTRIRFDYLDELIRLEENLPEFIKVPPRLATQIGNALISPQCFIKSPPMTYVSTNTIKKSSLVEYLLEGSQGPCHCGSGKRYEKCHSQEELPGLVKMILLANGGIIETERIYKGE